MHLQQLFAMKSNQLHYLLIIQTLIIILDATGMAIPPAAPVGSSSPTKHLSLGDRRNTPLEHPELQPIHGGELASKRRRASERFREYNLGRIMGDSANIIRRMHGRSLGNRYPLPPIKSSKNAYPIPSSIISSPSSDGETTNQSFHNQSMFIPNVGVLQYDQHQDPNRQDNANGTSSATPVLPSDTVCRKSVPVTSSVMRVSNPVFATMAVLTFLIFVGVLASIPIIFRHLVLQ